MSNYGSVEDIEKSTGIPFDVFESNTGLKCAYCRNHVQYCVCTEDDRRERNHKMLNKKEE